MSLQPEGSRYHRIETHCCCPPRRGGPRMSCRKSSLPYLWSEIIVQWWFSLEKKRDSEGVISDRKINFFSHHCLTRRVIPRKRPKTEQRKSFLLDPQPLCLSLINHSVLKGLLNKRVLKSRKSGHCWRGKKTEKAENGGREGGRRHGHENQTLRKEKRVKGIRKTKTLPVETGGTQIIGWSTQRNPLLIHFLFLFSSSCSWTNHQTHIFDKRITVEHILLLWVESKFLSYSFRIHFKIRFLFSSGFCCYVLQYNVILTWLPIKYPVSTI